MILLSAAIISATGYMAMKIKMRAFRLRGVSAAGVLATYGYLAPIYLLLALLLYQLNNYTLTPTYFLLLFTTAFLNWVSCFVVAWLLSRFPAGRLELLHKASIFFISALWDLTIIGWHPTLMQACVLGLAFGVALLMQFLQQNPAKVKRHNWRVVLWTVLLMLGTAAVTSIQWATFQLAIKIVGEGVTASLFHMGMHGVVTLGLFLILGHRCLIRDHKKGIFPAKDQLIMVSFLFIAATSEAIVLGGVPLTLFSLISLSGIGFLWAYDVWAGYEKFKLSKFALAMITLVSLGWLIYHL